MYHRNVQELGDGFDINDLVYLITSQNALQS